MLLKLDKTGSDGWCEKLKKLSQLDVVHSSSDGRHVLLSVSPQSKVHLFFLGSDVDGFLDSPSRVGLQGWDSGFIPCRWYGDRVWNVDSNSVLVIKPLQCLFVLRNTLLSLWGWDSGFILGFFHSTHHFEFYLIINMCFIFQLFCGRRSCGRSI